MDEDFLRQFDGLELPGEPSLIRQLVQRLMVSAPVRLASIKTAIDERDADRVRHEAHALKGIVGNVGAISLSGILQTLEKKGESREFDDAPKIFREIEAEFVAVADFLKKRYLEG